MNLDDRARQAAAELHEAARTAEIVAFDSVRWHRRVLLAAPAAALVALVAMAVLLLPGPSSPPVGPPTTSDVTTSDVTTTTAQTSTTSNAAIVPWLEPGTLWIRGGLSGVYDDSGALIEDVDFLSIGLLGGGRASAWDGDIGFVAISEKVLWFRDGEAVETDLPVGPIVEVVTVGGVPIVGIGPVDASGTTTWFDLSSSEPAEPPESARTVDGATFEAGGLVTFIDFPDWTSVSRGEGGELIPPFDLPELVVTDGAEELLRVAIGSEERPYALLHDFDGRRVVFSVEPYEPALAPRTVWIVDLECASCTVRVESDGPEWFDLVGTLAREGNLVYPTFP